MDMQQLASRPLALGALSAVWVGLTGCADPETMPRAMSDGPAGAAGTAGGGVGGAAAGTGPGGASSGGTGGIAAPVTDGGSCAQCSADRSSVIDCSGAVVEACAQGTECAGGRCATPCEAAAVNRSNVGCDYRPVYMDADGVASGGCFAAFVANTRDHAVRLELEFDGNTFDLSKHAAIPRGSGPTLTYEPYDAAAGLPAGEVAILFLAYDEAAKRGARPALPCPLPAAVVTAQVHNTSYGKAFRISSDSPVVAYQMLPYGGGRAAVTGATLLLPTSAWDTNYVAVQAYTRTWAYSFPPSMNIVAAEDDTEVTILPKGKIVGYGNIVPGSAPNVPVTYRLNAGEHVQFTEQEELTGSPVTSTKPVGLYAGHYCLNVPWDRDYCDHAEQQIPPVRALSHEYVAVGHATRSPERTEDVVEERHWRVVGTADGTTLTYEPDVPGPKQLALGEVVEFKTTEPFVVRSQDEAHPFMVFGYMAGSTMVDGPEGRGDADFVRIGPPAQYMKRYVFFTDPTYPETHLVVVRRRGSGGFAAVNLACRGVIDGWQDLGAGVYEYAHVPIVRGNFEAQDGCDNGRHEMTSDEPFGVWVWGWGNAETSNGDCLSGEGILSCDVSYAYPAGENLELINDVYVAPIPK